MIFAGCWERIKKATGMRRQSQLAAFLDISASSVTEAKNRDSFPLDWVQKIAREYDLSMDWILTGKGHMRRGFQGIVRERENDYRDPEDTLAGELNGYAPGVEDYDSAETREKVEEHNAIVATLKYILRHATEEERQRAIGWLYEMQQKIRARGDKKQ
jgi:hypothetical protein